MIGWRVVPLLLAMAGPVAAQQGQVVPEAARDLVVKIATYRRDTHQRAGIGAGVVFGGNDSVVYIVTAAHTISFRPPGRPVEEPRDTMDARIVLAGADSREIPATLVAIAPDTQLDVAVISVPRAAVGSHWNATVRLDRLGSVKGLVNGVSVWPLGCPGGACWEAPAQPDHVMAVDGRGILFQSSFVQVGSSGGALFNQWWEVVGMVTEDLTVRANAVPIDLVVTQLKRWQLPVMLVAPTVPRGGYRTTIGFSVLAPSPSPFDGDPDRTVPSGRVTFSRRKDSGFSWHVALVRLGPRDLAVTSGMAGVAFALNLGSDRFTMRPFVEAGFGQVEGRFDGGGYYVATPTGGTRYVPSWNRVVGDGLGVGGGATIEVITAPHVIMEVSAGYWSFTTPIGAPELKNVFFGLGARWGR
jgi:hypothetical protein